MAEADAILRRMRAEEPDFDFTYAPEVTRFVLRSRMTFVVGTWRKGDASSARRQLWAYFRTMPAMLSLLVASFLPFGTVYTLRQRNRFSRLLRYLGRSAARWLPSRSSVSRS